MPGSFIQYVATSPPPSTPTSKTLELVPAPQEKAVPDGKLKKLQDRAITLCGKYTQRSRFVLFNMPHADDAKQIMAHIKKTNTTEVDAPIERTMHLMAYLNCKLHGYMRDNLDIDMSKLPDPANVLGHTPAELEETLVKFERGEDQHEPSIMEQLAQIPAEATIRTKKDNYYNLLMDIINSEEYRGCAAEIAANKGLQQKYEGFARAYLIEHKLLEKDEQPDRRYYYA